MSKQAHLVNTAAKLFYQDGFHATGIDRILAEAGVAKMTLYNHFKSKDALILATLEKQSERFAENLRKTATQADTPRGALLALFDGLDVWFHSDKFAGCYFINACAEYTDLDHPVHAAATRHKQNTIDFVRDLCTRIGAPDPDGLSRQLAIIMEGAITTAQILGDPDAARHARAAAKTLIDAA